MAFGNLEAMLLGNLDGLSIGEEEGGKGLKFHLSVCFINYKFNCLSAFKSTSNLMDFDCSKSDEF